MTAELYILSGLYTAMRPIPDSTPMLALLSALACASPAPPATSAAPGAATGVAAIATQDGGVAPLRFGDPARLAYDVSFFAGTTYASDVTPPEEILGQPVGSRLARHDEVLACFERWAAESPRVTLERFGVTFEGRPLVRAVVTSSENHERLDGILADLGRLADPRDLSDADADAIAASSPAVAWLGYSIHGDEPSGTDASLAFGYHLAAAQSDEVAALLNDVVVVIDPCQNPDGRMRILRMIEENAGARTSLDHASLHRGRWPWGRGNHYLFDMNRDWLAATQPESRARWSEVQRFHPQLFVDVHEMGALDTYLFSPSREPINTHQPEANLGWNKAFGDEQAAAFDKYGWSYYTREWAENWYPGYSDSWGGLHGAIGILHEQARTLGAPLVRASGEVLTYRESVHHQAVGSYANMSSLARHRADVLRSYLAEKRANVAPDADARMFALRRGRHPDRERRLVEILRAQGLEVRVAREAFEVSDAQLALGEYSEQLELPAGTWFVPPGQPTFNIARAFLEFDPRLSDEVLLKERTELEQKNETRIYDVTAWSLAHAFDLDALWCAPESPESFVAGEAEEESLPPIVGPNDGAAVYGWVVDGLRDAAVAFAARALEAGLAVHVSDKPFTTAGRSFARGSLLVRRHENEGDVLSRVREVAQHTGVVAFATSSGRSRDEGPDLGGGHFHLLARPRIALLSNSPVRADTYGHIWFHLDQVLGVPLSLLDAQSLGSYDLRRFNVLIAPPGAGRVLGDYDERLRTWIAGGGTLIACGDAAASVASEELELSDVRLRRDALDDLASFEFALERERAARSIEVDSAAVWGDAEPVNSAAKPDATDGEKKGGSSDGAAREDEWRRRFSPAGAFLRAASDPHTWLTAGSPAELPIFHSGSHVYLAAPPVRTAVRFAPADELRVAGLVWPEARERIGDSAWATVERVGRGQVILFASVPGFRGTMRATARFLSNAVVYGPGAGASQPVDW